MTIASLLKIFGYATLGAAVGAVSSAQAQQAYHASPNGSARVQVSPGGFGFAGQIGPNGLQGVTTDGRSVGNVKPLPIPLPPVTSSLPSAGEPSVRFDMNGGVDVQVPGVHVAAGTGVGFLPFSGDEFVDSWPVTLSAAELCRAGRLDDARRAADRDAVWYPMDAQAALAVSVIAWRQGDHAAAAAAARRVWQLDLRSNVSVSVGTPGMAVVGSGRTFAWESVRRYFTDAGSYTAAVRELRACEQTADLDWLIASHAVVIGRSDIARESLEPMAGTDALAKALLRRLPPGLE